MNLSNFKIQREEKRSSLFELNVVSYHPETSGKKFKKYAIDGIDSVGVFADEAFGISFTNNSNETVQVRFSVDGTDVMTAKPASLEVNSQMFLVRPFRTFTLNAWHESQEGGSKFVFASGDKGVAVHTHGDISRELLPL